MTWKIFKKTDKKEKEKEITEEEKKVKEMMKEDKITQFKTKDEEDEYEKIKREVYGEKAYKEEKKFEKQAERNLVGIELEKKEKIEEAIKLYEQNVKENFIGNHPYDRLAIIYRKRGQLDEEIRILEKAVWVFENVVYKGRGDRIPKLEKFKKRLEKTRTLKSKQEGES